VTTRKKAYSPAFAAVVGDTPLGDIADREDEIREIASKTRTPADPPAGEDSAPVRRKRKETLIPFATRLPLGMPEEIKAHCEQMDELITDFMARAARDTIRRDRERYL
jgi:hypothetical protein